MSRRMSPTRDQRRQLPVFEFGRAGLARDSVVQFSPLLVCETQEV
jgi:hypothetical protein